MFSIKRILLTIQSDFSWSSLLSFLHFRRKQFTTKGKPELRDNLQLWYYPPQPALIYNQAPAPDRFFCHSFLLWMPYKLWRVKILCPNPACGQHQLTGGGLHKRARQVLDIDRTYNMVTETLICTKCRASHVSWSHTVLQQLDLGHRSEFQIILTQK